MTRRKGGEGSGVLVLVLLYVQPLPSLAPLILFSISALLVEQPPSFHVITKMTLDMIYKVLYLVVFRSHENVI